jgi:hypothetical protein
MKKRAAIGIFSVVIFCLVIIGAVYAQSSRCVILEKSENRALVNCGGATQNVNLGGRADQYRVGDSVDSSLVSQSTSSSSSSGGAGTSRTPGDPAGRNSPNRAR